MGDIYVGPNGSDAWAGTARRPKATYAGAAAIASKGDTIWISDQASLTEECTLISGTRVRNWGKDRFSIDATSLQHAMRADGVSDVVVIGADMANATANVFEHANNCSDVVLIDCKAHDSVVGNGFGCEALGNDDGQAFFFGCEAYDNANDGFNVKDNVEWWCIYCDSHDHNSSASSNDYTNHITARIHLYGCEGHGSVISVSHVATKGKNFIFNCFFWDCESGVQNAVQGTNDADDPCHIVAFGNIIAMDNSRAGGNSNHTGLGSRGAGDIVTAIHNTVRNPGVPDATNKYCFTGGVSSGALGGKIQGFGNVSIATGTRARHLWIYDPVVENQSAYWDHNIYTNATEASPFRIGNSNVDEAAWLAGNDGLDQVSRLTDTYAPLSTGLDGVSEGLRSVITTSGARRSVPTKALLEEYFPWVLPEAEAKFGEARAQWDRVMAELGGKPIKVNQPINDVEVVGCPRHFTYSDVSGSFFDIEMFELCDAGAFFNQVDGGVWQFDGGAGGRFQYDSTAAASNVRVNAFSIAGDRSKRVRIKGGSFGVADALNAATYQFTSGLFGTGRILFGGLNTSVPQPFTAVVGAPGEDIYFTCGSGAAKQCVVDYVIEDVGDLNGVDQIKGAGGLMIH